MPVHIILNYIAIAILLLAAAIGGLRYKQLDGAARIIFYVVCLGFLAEVAARAVAVWTGNNMAVYNIYSLAEYCLMCAYFHCSLPQLRRRGAGLIIAGAGLGLGILNTIFLQPITTLNSYFLYFEGIVVIGLSLFSFFCRLLVSDGQHLYRFMHFWLPVIFCAYWAITFFNWGLYSYFLVAQKEWLNVINNFIVVVSILCDLAIALVFWRLPKFQKQA